MESHPNGWIPQNKPTDQNTSTWKSLSVGAGTKFQTDSVDVGLKIGVQKLRFSCCVAPDLEKKTQES